MHDRSDHRHSHFDRHGHSHSQDRADPQKRAGADPALVGHGHGHNHDHGSPDHLHSHALGHAGHERAEEIKMLASAFVDGFRAAEDKPSFLRLAGIPFNRAGPDGLSQHLVDARIESHWQLGTASPAFGSRELAYLPYPGAMVTGHETLKFTYVSLTARAEIDLVTLLAEREDRGV